MVISAHIAKDYGCTLATCGDHCKCFILVPKILLAAPCTPSSGSCPRPPCHAQMPERDAPWPKYCRTHQSRGPSPHLAVTKLADEGCLTHTLGVGHSLVDWKTQRMWPPSDRRPSPAATSCFYLSTSRGTGLHLFVSILGGNPGMRFSSPFNVETREQRVELPFTGYRTTAAMSLSL